MKKTDFRDYVLGTARSIGVSTEDLMKLTGLSRATLYRKLRDPDTLDRLTLKLLHRHLGIAYEELIERR